MSLGARENVRRPWAIAIWQAHQPLPFPSIPASFTPLPQHFHSLLTRAQHLRSTVHPHMDATQAATGGTPSSSSTTSLSVFHPAHVVLPSSSRLSLQPQAERNGLFFSTAPRPPLGVLPRSPRTRTRRKSAHSEEAEAVQAGEHFYAASAPPPRTAPPLCIQRGVRVVKGKVVVLDAPVARAPSEAGGAAPPPAASPPQQHASAPPAPPAQPTQTQAALEPAFMPSSAAPSTSSTSSPPPSSPVTPVAATSAAAARKPAWGAPRSWASLAATSPSTSSAASVSRAASPTAGAASASQQRNGAGKAPGSAPGKAASGKTASGRSKMEALQSRLRAAERCFSAPLTAPRGMINKGNFCFANAVSRRAAHSLCPSLAGAGLLIPAPRAM